MPTQAVPRNIAKTCRLTFHMLFLCLLLLGMLSGTSLEAQDNHAPVKPNSVGKLPDHPPASVVLAAALAIKQTDFQTALANVDAVTAQKTLQANGMPTTIQVVVHSTGGASTDPLDNVNGPCYQWGWYYSHSNYPPPNGTSYITWGRVSYVGSTYLELGNIWYWQ